MSNDFQLFTSLRFDPGLIGVPKRRLANAGWNAKMTSPFYMLDFHRDRMLRAATHWNWTPAIESISGSAGLQRLTEAIESFLAQHGKETALRVKVLLSSEGHFSCEASSVPAVHLENLFPERLPPPESPKQAGDPSEESPMEVVIDKTETPQSEYTHYKTTKRAMYDTARDRENIAPTDRKEVLLVNSKDGNIMEGSLTTPFFWRNGRWVTPPVSAKYSPENGSGGQDGTTRRWALERGLAVEEEVKADSIVDGEPCWVSNGVRGFTFGKLHFNSAKEV
ncbi:aminodeoxychorismate lyase [Colletotrichum tofieldiae]|uniref:Aminodeoxychorismate lyase n=1 Tax=Colletotrichum tofieldiae TaxID=708197 RepID=A0A166XTK8_9PEZI|nr:aminodeoxychorismate lyase [Colletotrichum tofieldiae]GKT60510.1 aminodeoxychorismate lyase [Colletotrichum tofieldiae]GKT68215.1 aminodeoxychorismate lyase [Colletotrichum tofieldiae]